ncbi:MAG: metallophosphoesterase [Coriobacteriales bacterium]
MAAADGALTRAGFLAAGAVGGVATALALAGVAGRHAAGRRGLAGAEQARDGDDGSAAGDGVGDEAEAAAEGAAGETGETQVPITIAVASDPHFLSPRLTDHGACFESAIRSSDAKCMEYSEQIVDAFVAQVLAERPDAVAITGDLTYNGALESHQDMAAKLRGLVDAGIPVFVVAGNHDVNCEYAARFEGDERLGVASATPEQFAQIYADFGYAGALARDDASLSYVAELDAGDRGRLRLLFVDVNGVDEPGTVGASTLAWARDQLEAARADGVAVVSLTHQNLLDQAFVSKGYTIDNAADLLALYDELGVRFNLSGHLHCQHYAQSDSGLVDMATSALCVTPVQLARVRVSGLGAGGSASASAGEGARAGLGGARLDYETVPLDMRSWALAQPDASVSANPDLLDFPAYARDFFAHTSYDQVYAGAVGAGYDEASAAALAQYATDAVCLWFAGRLDTLERDVDCESEISAFSPMVGYFFAYSLDEHAPRNENIVSVAL